MNDALVSAQKYVNAEAATLFIIIFAYGSDYFASAFTYFCAERSASYVSRSVDIRTYLLREQVTSIHGYPYLWILMSHLQRCPWQITFSLLKILKFLARLGLEISFSKDWQPYESFQNFRKKIYFTNLQKCFRKRYDHKVRGFTKTKTNQIFVFVFVLP